MAIDEAMRHRIHGRLDELLGHEEAAAFMSALTDMDRLEESLAHTREMLMLHTTATVAEAVGTLRGEMNSMMRMVLQWTIGSMFAAASLGLAAGRLLGG